jgi:hypothetical protein
VGKDQKIVSWNIGFGAYEDDYGFFMDGGTQSWAWSKERLDANLTKIGEMPKEQDSPFYLIQEVDFSSTRTYKLDEIAYMTKALRKMSYTFAQNYDSPFLLYPLNQPHGANKADIMTFSKYNIKSATRRELPIEEGVRKFLDLERCYSVNRIPAEGGQFLAAAGQKDIAIARRENRRDLLCRRSVDCLRILSGPDRPRNPLIGDGMGRCPDRTPDIVRHLRRKRMRRIDHKPWLFFLYQSKHLFLIQALTRDSELTCFADCVACFLRISFASPCFQKRSAIFRCGKRMHVNPGLAKRFRQFFSFNCSCKQKNICHFSPFSCIWRFGLALFSYMSAQRALYP